MSMYRKYKCPHCEKEHDYAINAYGSYQCPSCQTTHNGCGQVLRDDWEDDCDEPLDEDY